MAGLVEVSGIQPLTSCMPCRRGFYQPQRLVWVSPKPPGVSAPLSIKRLRAFRPVSFRHSSGLPTPTKETPASFHIIFPTVSIGLGAFLVVVKGIWLKTGNAPLVLAPERDDPQLASDPKRNNEFSYADAGAPDAGTFSDAVANYL